MFTRLLTLILLAFIHNNGNAQQIYFYFNDASVQVYNLDELSRIDFDANNINLHLTDQSLISYNTDLLNYYRYFAEGTTSIQENSSHPEFKVYPNPADNKLNLKLEFFKPSKLNIRVQTIQGVLMMEKSIQMTNQDDLQLDISGFASGQYICIIDAGDFLVSKSFIKK